MDGSASRAVEDSDIAVSSAPRPWARTARWLFSTGGRQVLWTLVPVVAVMAIWEAIAWSGLQSRVLFPPIEDMFAGIGEMMTRGTLWTDAVATFVRLIVGVVIGLVIGTFIGLAMGWTRNVERLVVPLMNFGLATPGIALIPIAVLWFGLTNFTVTIIVVAEVILVAMLHTWTGVKSVDRNIVLAGRAFGAQGAEMFLRVLLPGALPSIIGGYRMAFSRAWRILVAVEMLVGVGSGLGYRISEAQTFFKTDVIYGGVLIIGIMGLILERVALRSLESITIDKWGMTRDGRNG